MDLYETKARAILAIMVETKGLEALGEDRPLLDFIKELLKELVPILINCFASVALAAKEMRAPGVVTRVRLRLGIRQRCGDDETVNVLGRPLFHSTLAVMKSTTDAEVKEMAVSF